MLSATLVAVIVNGPAAAEENVTEVIVWFASDPPVVVQVTPAPPRSLVTVALIACVCDVVNPPRFGLMETVIVEGCVIAQLTVTLVMFVPVIVPAPFATVQLWRAGWVSTVTL